MRLLLRAFPLLALLCHAKAFAAPTEQVFASHQAAVVQVRLLDIDSGAQHSIGSGFHVGQGLIVTNYHVVADLLDKHARYRAEARRYDEQQTALTLVAVDVVHDLALVQAAVSPARQLSLAPRMPAHGERLYSFGIPLDLGFTIVEGTYNGVVKGSLLQSMHFTGSLNPGMSGGPAVLADGQVAGINVASSGEQVSYLVPVRYAQQLVEKFRKHPGARPDRKALLAAVRQQLLDHQSVLIETLLARPLPATTLGRFAVPDTGVHWISCWGDTSRNEKFLVQSSGRYCNYEESIFLSDELATSGISYSHSWLDGSALGLPRFLKVYSHQYEKRFASGGDTDDQTGYSCHQDFFRKGRNVFRSALCLRGYKDFPGLYDVAFTAASQHNAPQGLLTSLYANGLSLSNARRLVAAYIATLDTAAPASAQRR